MFNRISQIERRFRRIAATLKPFELQADDEQSPLASDALNNALFTRAQSYRLLGYYSETGIRRALEVYGITAQLAARGFPTLHYRMNLDDPRHHQLQIFYRSSCDPDSLLVDLALHCGSARELETFPRAYRVELLVIDWLMLQDPRIDAGPERLLPGQKHPGLGLGLEFGGLLSQVAQRLKLDGLLAFPAWFHNAAFYQLRYHFVSPVMEGRFRALLRDTRGHEVHEISWAVELGCVFEHLRGDLDKSHVPGKVFRWAGRPMVWVTGESEGAQALTRYFERPAWRGQRDAIFDGVFFTVDWDAVARARQDERSLPSN